MHSPRSISLKVKVCGCERMRACVCACVFMYMHATYPQVLACYMLQQLPEYRDAEIVRSREQAVLDECDIVVDVGGVYDPATHRYDHHQKYVACSWFCLLVGVSVYPS